MTGFWDEFNRKHNPRVLYLKDAPEGIQKKKIKQRGELYYYDKKTEKKETKKKKTDRKRYSNKRYPVFKMQNRVD